MPDDQNEGSRREFMKNAGLVMGGIVAATSPALQGIAEAQTPKKSQCHPPDPKAKIVDILAKSLQTNFNSKINQVTVEDLMVLAGWIGPNGPSPQLMALTMDDLNTIGSALEKHTGTKYVKGVACCCTCV